MSQHITVRGFVATDPTIRNAQAGFPVGNFRLAATDRRFDREQNAWVDGNTNWFTVNLFRSLAQNAFTSLQKGQPVVVTGRLKVRPWETEERSGTAVEIEADTIGHDLSLGTATFQRSSGRPGEVATGAAEAGTGSGEPVGPGRPGEEAFDRETGELLGHEVDEAGAAEADGDSDTGEDSADSQALSAA
ncbi:single-stranded DNA-binding protein [Citricoccus nitrophenolicus]|uniref:Single-stranded DNA-binding protein n=1 Tax=Citricoccus muralis TaxID=169134 RepID=A0A3D9LCC2_9MICC|nr:single-stranded DNA-binding protein [Citricoccus muralis]REE02833.1 single-strand DNA-binding protein [Citricoccus muralis]